MIYDHAHGRTHLSTEHHCVNSPLNGLQLKILVMGYPKSSDHCLLFNSPDKCTVLPHFPRIEPGPNQRLNIAEAFDIFDLAQYACNKDLGLLRVALAFSDLAKQLGLEG